MTTTTVDPERARSYDRFKLIVALILAALLIVLCLMAQSAAQVAVVPTVAPAATSAPQATQPPATQPPAASLTAPTVSAEVSDGKLALTGTGTPGGTVQIVIDGNVAGTAPVGADGKWSFNTDLAPGDHDIAVDALDAAGGVAASAKPLRVSVPLPIAAPSLDPFAANLTPGAIPLTGLGTPGTQVQIVIDGTAAGTADVGTDGKWRFDAGLAAGAHRIDVNALDAAGAVAAASAPVTVTLAEAVSVLAPTLDTPTGALSIGKVTLTGTGAPGTKVQIVIGGVAAGEAEVGADGKWTFDADFPNAGAVPVVVNALDAAGKAAAASDATTLAIGAATQTPTATPPGSAIPIKNICDYSDPTVYGEDKGAYWLVDRCDTMSYIARQTNIPLAALIAANPQVTNPNLIYPQQQIVLPR